nr:hypothetical protein [Tanacetum cinerariifolium]
MLISLIFCGKTLYIRLNIKIQRRAMRCIILVATGATPPKTKASVRKTKSSFDTTFTPPPTAAAGTRLFTSAKGKQPATTSKAKNEGTGTIPGVLDVHTEESDEEISWKSSDEGDDDNYDEEGDDVMMKKKEMMNKMMMIRRMKGMLMRMIKRKMELKKILIEKMEGNKFIHRSNEKRNLYKALVEAYESDKIILDTYEDTVTLKRR